MDCIQTRDWLLQAEHVNRYTELPLEEAARLQAHLETCTDCRGLQQKVLHLESRWRAQPLVPSAQAVDRSREAFLRRLPQPADTDNHVILRGPWLTRPVAARWLMAAVLLLAVGLGSWMMLIPSRTPSAETLVGRLLDWNLDLTKTPAGPEHDRLANHAGAFQAEIHKARLAPEDRELAQTLLENGAWLAQHHNPIEQLEGLNGVADRLMDQMAKVQDPRKAAELAAQYLRVSDEGIKATVVGLRANGQLTDEDRRKLDIVESRHTDRQKKIEDQHKPSRTGARDRGEDKHRH